MFSLSSVQMLVGLCTRPQGRPGVGSSEPAGLGKAGAATEPAFYQGPEGSPLPSTSALAKSICSIVPATYGQGIVGLVCVGRKTSG